MTDLDHMILLALALGTNFTAGLWCFLDTLDRIRAGEELPFGPLGTALVRGTPPALILIFILVTYL